MKKKQYIVGDWVEVKSREEILRVLDHQGQTDGMPFMPEMFAYCGKRFQIQKRAHKTCDTVFPTRGRTLRDAVHLETRCDGSGHGGCQAGCLIFWKDSWLKRVDEGVSPAVPVSNIAHNSPGGPAIGSVCSEDAVRAAAVIASQDSPNSEPQYVCQATQLPYFTEDLAWWHVRQYFEDYRSGNVGLWRMFQTWIFSCYYHVVQSGIGAGPALRWLYDRLHFLWGGPRYPRLGGTIPSDEPTPLAALNLREGELVRVKSHEEILKTINVDGKNRGMYWDAEMVPYCGGTFRVRKRVERLVDERTGKMLNMKTAAVQLEDVTCQGIYSCHRLFCPRSLFPFWREIWLERQ